jgi:hypothetical protein
MFTNLNQGQIMNKIWESNIKEGYTSCGPMDENTDCSSLADGCETQCHLEKIGSLNTRNDNNILSEYNRDLKTLFCTHGTTGVKMRNNDCVWSTITKPDLTFYATAATGGENSSCTDTNGQGNCANYEFPVADKIVYDSEDIEDNRKFYYVNKFGYKKLLGTFDKGSTAAKDVHSACSGKEIVGLKNSEIIALKDFKTNNEDTSSLHKIYKKCDDGDYNINLTKGSGYTNPDVNVAYMSPSGYIYPYNNDVWSTIKKKNNLCGDKELVGVEVTGDLSYQTTEWSQPDTSKFGSGTITDTSSMESDVEKTAFCFPYANEDDTKNIYKTNVKNFIKSSIKVSNMNQNYIENIKYLDTNFLGTDVDGSIRKKLGNLKTGSNNVDVDLDNLKKETDILLSNKKKLLAKQSSINDLEREKNSVQMQKYLWLGSAIVLGAIVVKGVNNF